MRTIKADWREKKGKHDKFFRVCVGSGHAALGLRADYLAHLRMVRKECGFEFLRFHGLLHDDMAVYAEDREGNPKYNFQYVDSLYDSMLEIGIRPFVELGFMPSALASGDKTIFWWKGNITPPKSYEKWHDLVRELTKHFEDRYGRDEVKKWYFEVWNEPNLEAFFSGTQDEYFRMYEEAAKAIKAVCPDYRVGGPATAGNAWVKEQIAFCREKKVPIDFVSTHTYGVWGFLDEFGADQQFLSADPGAITNDVIGVHDQVKSSAMPDLEIHYTEWNTSYSSRDPVHDHYISPAYILSKLKGVEGKVDSMSYWTFTDVFEEAGPPPKPFHGGFGLVNMQGLRKPSFFAYRFLNELGRTELVSSDPASWVCRDKDEIQALFWDFSPVEPKESNQVTYTRDLPAADAGKVTVEFSGVPAGGYSLNVYQVGYRMNDLFGEFMAAGSPRDLAPAMVKEFAARTSGAPILTKTVEIGPEGEFAHEVAIRRNDVFLATLTRNGAR